MEARSTPDARAATPHPASRRVESWTLGCAVALLSGPVLGCNALSGVGDFTVEGTDGGPSADGSEASGADSSGADGSGADSSGADAPGPGESTAPTALRVRCGITHGKPYVDSMGHTWLNDEDYSPANTMTVYRMFNVSGTADPVLYYSERYADRTQFPAGFTYTFPVPAGSYTVKLHFAETNGFMSVGYREFNVSIDGKQVLSNFDIVATGGYGTAVIETFTATVTAGNSLVIEFTPGNVQNPKVDAIEVLSN